MKKVSLLVLALMFNALTAFTQEMDVNSFKIQEAYTLKGDEIQKDGNGNICAMILVQFNEDGMAFENSYLINTSSSSKPYKVFMAGGASKLTLKHGNYYPSTITFENYGIKRLQAGSVYTLNIIADNTENALNKDFAEEDHKSQADAGDAEAQFKQAKIYYHGLEDEPDYEMAFELFSKSAAQGNINAIYHLGLSYFHGQGTQTNLTQAVSYFRKAAEQGHAMAQFKYANCLNPMVPEIAGRKNIKEAILWYE